MHTPSSPARCAAAVCTLRRATRGRSRSRRIPALPIAFWALFLAGALVLSPLFAVAQDQGSSGGGQSGQSPITPAPLPTTPSSEPESLFPQAGPQNLSGTTLDREVSRAGSELTSEGGLGFGPIHPGDIAEVRVFEAPEFSARMPVSPTGDIAIPVLGVVHIAGMTSTEAATKIQDLFATRQILLHPYVTVTVRQFGFGVTVLGEVKHSGVYPLIGKKRLIDVLTEAGGLTDHAGHIIEISDTGSMKNATSLIWDPRLRENDNADIQLKPGQTVLVSRCGLVYVGGNVNKPGAFPLCDSVQTTLSQVIALAQGIKPFSWGQRTLLLRSADNGTRVVQKVRLEDVLRGRQPDLVLQNDDIVFVPPSGLKAAGRVIVQAAIGFATQAYLYVH